MAQEPNPFWPKKSTEGGLACVLEAGQGVNTRSHLGKTCFLTPRTLKTSPMQARFSLF